MTPDRPRETPRFSVVIPTYRRAHLLPRAVASVTSQTIRDLEILIVDDASPDSTQQVMASFRDSRIRHIRHDHNRGIGAARNTGIRAASASLVAFLDDDDEYLPTFLEQTWETYRSTKPEIGWTWCGVIHVRPNGTETPAPLWKPTFASLHEAYRGFLYYREVGTSSGFTARRQVLFDAGLFDERMEGGAEDTDFFIRLARTARFGVVEKHLLRFHDHPGPRLRRSTVAKARDYERIIERHRAALEEDARLWSATHYKASWLYFHGGNRTDGRRCALEALKKTPWKGKVWITWLGCELLGGRAASLHRAVSSTTQEIRAWLGRGMAS